jgi:hypothetical protein
MAIDWVLSGLMAALLGVLSAALFATIGRFDARFDAVHQRIDATGTEIRSDLQVFDERLRGVGS